MRFDDIHSFLLKLDENSVGFSDILKLVEEKSALKRNVTLDEVANTALFLSSDSASGITGQIVYVDCGFNTSGT